MQRGSDASQTRDPFLILRLAFPWVPDQRCALSGRHVVRASNIAVIPRRMRALAPFNAWNFVT